jgi:hypothetical protein
LARRLIFALIFLAVLDPFVVPAVHRLERRHYEGQDVFRFDDSDLFALGPLVSYLRENPRGTRRRVMFLGNSVLFGYGRSPQETVPAQFEKLVPGTRVFNAAFDGEGIGSSYLIAKDVIDSVDGFFILQQGQGAERTLASLVPVDGPDAREFQLDPPDTTEKRLESWLGFWHLYAFSYRLQAALFGGSTREYVYLHKKDIFRNLISLVHPLPARNAEAVVGSRETVALRAPRSAAPSPSTLRAFRQRHEPEFKIAELARSHRKRIVILCPNVMRTDVTDAEMADYNTVYAPFAEIVGITVPSALTFDGMHFTAEGARLVAEAVAQHEREGGAAIR